MNSLSEYINHNRRAWNARVPVHVRSSFYDVEGWKREGGISLTGIELREMGDVRGRSLLHLQCHFGQDTLSWARLGAHVVGCDFSEPAIAQARQLAEELSLPAEFVCCSVYDLPQYLSGEFDIVFTSYGVLGWLPDLEPWANVVAHFLKPGGVFYIAEFHPVLWMLDEQMQALKYPYHNAGVIESELNSTYADRSAVLSGKEYNWNHSLSEVLGSLLRRGLQLEQFEEYPYSPFNCFPNAVRGDDGYYRIRGLENVLPLVFTLRMRKGGGGAVTDPA